MIFQKKNCNYEELREQRSKIMTEIDNNLKNLISKDKNLSFKFRLEYKSLLESVRDYIDNYDEEVTYKKEANKLAQLVLLKFIVIYNIILLKLDLKMFILRITKSKKNNIY